MGPLAGVKVIEMKGIGPGPYAGMLLADMGATVTVVERASRTIGIALPSRKDVMSRGKQSIALDIKNPEGLAALLRLVEDTDVFFEGYRPGVAERLGFGPDDCQKINPRVVYGRMTGWGQTGPLAQTAGHDINYISITGALAAIGTKDKPVPPLNLVGDYAGGSLFLVMGMLAALVETKTSGKGQVVDAAITDGSASLMSMFHTLAALGQWSTERHSNLLDGAAHNYSVYETADGRYISVGPIEPQFYKLFVETAGLDPKVFGERNSPADWRDLKPRIADAIKSRTQKEWCDLFGGLDACVAPVLNYDEAPQHPHNLARRTYIDIDGLVQGAPAPRFSRTECETPEAPHAEGDDTDSVLRQAGFSEAEIARLRESGALT